VRTRSIILALIVVGCGGGPKSDSSTTGGGGGGGGDTSCEPGRCLDDIGSAFDRDPSAGRACYDGGTDPAFAAGGRVVINFEIGPDGAVVDASQAMREGQITEQAVVDCLIGVVKGVTFAPSKAGKSTRAFHTFEFSERR
jgi:hypothetical protein